MSNGPWPDDEVENTAVHGSSGATEHTDIGRFDDEPDDAPAGSRGVALAIAGGSIGFHVILAWILVAAIYTFLTIYALVKAIGSAPDEPNATVVVVGIVGLVTGLLLIFAAGVGLLGRAANPKKRRR